MVFYIIFSVITIVVSSTAVILNCRGKDGQKSEKPVAAAAATATNSVKKTDESVAKPEKMVTEEDVFADLKLTLAQHENKTQSDSLKDCSMRDEKNPLYNDKKSEKMSMMGGPIGQAPPPKAPPKRLIKTEATQESEKKASRRLDTTQEDGK